MALKLYSDSDIQDIADAIRGKNGSSDTYKVSQMASAITAIPTGSTPTGTKNISITQNGTTTEDVTSYASAEITVNVSGGGYAEDFKAVLERTATNPNLPSDLTTIGNSAFKDFTTLTNITIPSGVTSIGSSAFSGCNNLTSVTIPSGVTTILNSTFENCYNLASVTIPNGVAGAIGNYAFKDCRKLPLIILPSGVTSLGTSACNGCYLLTTLVLRRSDAVCTLGNINALATTPIRGYNGLTGTVYVPSALIESYKAASNWSTIFSAGTVQFVAIEGSVYDD